MSAPSPDATRALTALTGMVAFMAWLWRWQHAFPDTLVRQHGWWHLGSLPSQRWALGYPRGTHTSRPAFLGYQEDEGAWCTRLPWEKIGVVPGHARLYLKTACISSLEGSEGGTVKPLPSWGISLSLADPAVLPYWATPGDKVAFQALSWGQDGRICVAPPSTARIPVVAASSEEEVLNWLHNDDTMWDAFLQKHRFTSSLFQAPLPGRGI